MLLTDADSIMYKIEAENVQKNFYKDKKLFDLSNYPKDSKCYKYANNLINKTKDESGGVHTKAFVGLTFKTFTLIHF